MGNNGALLSLELIHGVFQAEAKPLWTSLFKQLTKKHLSVQPGNCSAARLPVHLVSHTCL
jgi:hypothetical protein